MPASPRVDIRALIATANDYVVIFDGALTFRGLFSSVARAWELPVFLDPSPCFPVVDDLAASARSRTAAVKLLLEIERASLGTTKRAACARGLTRVLFLLACSLSLCRDAQAVPSFTRQTGLVCNVCHSTPPELTAFGRKFKLDGYTLTDKKPDTTIDDKDLRLSRYFPIGGMASVGETGTNSPEPGAQNWNANAHLTLYLAGEMAPHVGAMIQTTYATGSDHLTLNNTDIRYANHTTIGSKDFYLDLRSTIARR